MTFAIDQPPPPRPKRWTKREYNELVAKGAFQGQRIYLFRGDIIERSQHRHAQAYAITELTAALYKAFGIRGGLEIRIQLPFDTLGESLPEPDGLVCTEEQGLRRPHPNEALLVVEVADSSLAHDRDKALEYAAAGVPEYWIVDVINRRVEVYREPTPDTTTEPGFRYASMRVFNASESIEPVSSPGKQVSVSQFFH